MLCKRPLTREQQLLGAHANYHAPRHSLPPLAPRPARHTICGRLPSFSKFVKDKQRLSLPDLNTCDLPQDNFKQYEIDGKFYVMTSVTNESRSTYQRLTAEGRRLTYQLEVVQAPARARACGNGPRSSADRRPVDPPPVVKLTVHHDNVDITASYQANFMLFASLEFSRPTAAGRGMMPTQHCPVLTGVCVAGAAYLAKPQAAAYFIFADLSVRHEGFYRLKFHLFEQNKRREDLDAEVAHALAAESAGSYEGPVSSEQMVNRMHVSTTPFQVYSAKKFPGLQESTAISQQMAEQGIRVRIRREIRQRTDKSRKSGDKPDDEQRSIRAISHDRTAYSDNYSHPAGSQRSSVDHSRAPSRQQSYNPSLVASPPTITPTIARPYSNYTTTDSTVSHLTDSWQSSSHSSVSQSSIQTIHAQPPHRPSSTNLPSIASMIHDMTPSEPARPQGGYYSVASPAAKKRALNTRAEDTSAALKDRARPSLTPISRTPTVPSWSPRGTTFVDSSRFPLAPGETFIEADDDDDDDDDNHSETSQDYVLTSTISSMHTYKRAGGGLGHVPRL